MQPPTVTIVRGSPTPSDEAAVRAAIVASWREDVAASAREARGDPWVAAARREGLSGAETHARLRLG